MNVPAVVTGLPLTANQLGNDNAALVTVPVPLPPEKVNVQVLLLRLQFSGLVQLKLTGSW